MTDVELDLSRCPKELEMELIVLIDIINYHDSILIPDGESDVEDCGSNSLYCGRPEGTGAVE
jgi:hypothetical protein